VVETLFLAQFKFLSVLQCFVVDVERDLSVVIKVVRFYNDKIIHDITKPLSYSATIGKAHVVLAFQDWNVVVVVFYFLFFIS
jgi:hypothetical protein